MNCASVQLDLPYKSLKTHQATGKLFYNSEAGKICVQKVPAPEACDEYFIVRTKDLLSTIEPNYEQITYQATNSKYHFLRIYTKSIKETDDIIFYAISESSCKILSSRDAQMLKIPEESRGIPRKEQGE